VIDMAEFVQACSGGGCVLPWFWELGTSSMDLSHTRSSSMRLSQIRQLFDDIDIDGSGSISNGELTNALIVSGVTKSSAPVLFYASDVWGSNAVDWWEFSTQFQRKLLPIMRAKIPARGVIHRPNIPVVDEGPSEFEMKVIDLPMMMSMGMFRDSRKTVESATEQRVRLFVSAGTKTTRIVPHSAVGACITVGGSTVIDGGKSKILQVPSEVQVVVTKDDDTVRKYIVVITDEKLRDLIEFDGDIVGPVPLIDEKIIEGGKEIRVCVRPGTNQITLIHNFGEENCVNIDGVIYKKGRGIVISGIEVGKPRQVLVTVTGEDGREKKFSIVISNDCKM